MNVTVIRKDGKAFLYSNVIPVAYRNGQLHLVDAAGSIDVHRYAEGTWLSFFAHIDPEPEAADDWKRIAEDLAAAISVSTETGKSAMERFQAARERRRS